MRLSRAPERRPAAVRAPPPRAASLAWSVACSRTDARRIRRSCRSQGAHVLPSATRPATNGLPLRPLRRAPWPGAIALRALGPTHSISPFSRLTSLAPMFVPVIPQQYHADFQPPYRRGARLRRADHLRRSSTPQKLHSGRSEAAAAAPCRTPRYRPGYFEKPVYEIRSSKANSARVTHLVASCPRDRRPARSRPYRRARPVLALATCCKRRSSTSSAGIVLPPRRKLGPEPPSLSVSAGARRGDEVSVTAASALAPAGVVCRARL